MEWQLGTSERGNNIGQGAVWKLKPAVISGHDADKKVTGIDTSLHEGSLSTQLTFQAGHTQEMGEAC